MALCWLNLLIGTLCIDSFLAFSSIPEERLESLEDSDDEWAQYNELLRDPNYRLPKTTRPNNYAVTLAPFLATVPANVPNAEPFTFDGEVAITISATEENVDEIVLHCNNLTISELTVSLDTSTVNLASNRAFTCEMPWSFLRVNLTTTLLTNRNYIIRSKFKGRLQTNMRGFYRSSYVDSTGRRRWMATTQFQPGHARQAFPCYDEPEFKARFDITIIREADYSPTLSNMPIKSSTNRTDGRVSETFHTTPITSSYLVAFIVSHYKAVSVGANNLRPFYMYARDNVGITGDWALNVGERLLTAMEDYTQYPYYSMTPNIIMQQAAIPDFSAGAMENWGLLTYREALILYDPLNSNHFYKQRVANIVAHEITHQWFGNLVTCAWWDNLWLNEGFARFYTYYLAAMVEPELGFDTRFIVEQVQVSLLSDSVDSAHALTNPAVDDPSTVSAHFSTITYAKGASVLRMTQHLLGDSTYQKGLRNYLRRNEWSVAEPKDLFNALQDAALEDRSLTTYGGITVEDYMKTWTEQAGHPLLTVNVDHSTGIMRISQKRFNVDSGVSSISSLWFIPITWTRAGAIDFTNLKPMGIFSIESIIILRGSIGREWVIFNKQQSGFYRVNYDSITWSLITQALRSSSRVQIHEYNRAQIVDDVFIMARAGILTYDVAFNILSFLEFEDQYAPWIAAIAGLNFSRRRLAHNNTSVTQLESLINTFSTAVTRRLGFAEIPNEPFMDGLLRMYVNTFLCNNGHQQCIEAGRAAFANWRVNNTFIPANMRPWVYCTGLRYGTAADFTFFWNRYLSETLASEEVVMLTAAGCTRDQGSLQTFLNAITAGDDDYVIRNQDQSTAINSALTSNDGSPLMAFEWLKDNIKRTIDALGSINSLLNTIASRLLNEREISEVRTWLETNRATIGESAYNTGISGINASRNNMAWYLRREPEYSKYFRTGYIEDTTTTTTTTLVVPPIRTTTVAPSTTPQGGSASIVTFNIVTLLVTLAYNLV